MKENSKYSEYSKEELISEITELKKRKKYGLVWDEEREPENVVKECKKKLPVLKEVKNRSKFSSSSETTHILIEGDNYHSLSVLNYTHKSKIDVIYIDPPYNTGAKDWKYNNNYVDGEDSYRHSKWLSFMKNRLVLAKNLLTKSGVLICAIDENEQERTGLLLEEIFPTYQKTCVTIIHNPGGIQGDNFSYCHEYAYFVFPSGGRYINLQDRVDSPDIRPLRDVSTGNHLRENAANCFYPIYVKNNKIIGFGNVCKDDFHPKSANINRNDGTLEIYPIDSQGNERKWTFARQNVEKIQNELSVEFNKRRKIWDVIRTKNQFNYKTVWTDKKFNSNSYGSSLLNKLIDNKFPFPKSLYNVKECLDAAVKNKPDAIILDFFAGSGTTAQAVLEMNRLDNGNRKFILCTNNEGNICEDICYPRVLNVMGGYQAKTKARSLLFDKKLTLKDLSNTKEIFDQIKELSISTKKQFDSFENEFEMNTIKLYGVNKKQKKIAGLGGNLKYYQTSFVPNLATDRNKENLTRKSTEMICLKEDTYEVVSESNNTKIFKNDLQFTAILFDEDGISDLKKIIVNYELPIVVYIFSLADDDFSDHFSDLKNKIEVKSIPAAILRLYKRIFR